MTDPATQRDDIQRSLGRIEGDVRALLITTAEAAKHQYELDQRVRMLETNQARLFGGAAAVGTLMGSVGAYLGWLFRHTT